MRSRSSTVHMKASPFKKPTAKPVETNEELSSSASSVKIPTLSKEDKIKLFEDFGPLANDCCNEDLFDSPRTCSTAIPSTSCLMTMSRLSSTFEDDSSEETKVFKTFRGMIVGAQGTGRHSLVNAICPESSSDSSSQMKQEFDLLTRRVETEAEINRMNFWLRETKSDQRYDSLVKTYYKSCSVFFLVYSVHDKNTLEILNNEIKLIQEANAGKEKLFVLIGNKRAAKKCQVSYNDALEFKRKNNIKLCLEVDLAAEKLQNIMDIIQTLGK